MKLLKLPSGQRFACVRRGASVDVLDDRCPHEGHPLSMGSVRDGILTCPWHNWKFALDSGACVAGGESARRYEAEIHGDEVFVDLRSDRADLVAVARLDLERALREGDLGAAVRVGLRWSAAIEGDLRPIRAAIARSVAAACDRRLGDAVPAIAAIESIARTRALDDAEQIAVAAQAAIDEIHGRPPVPWPARCTGSIDAPEPFLEDLLEERRPSAIARAVGAAADPRSIARRWFLPFLSTKLWDRGDALPRIAATIEIVDDAEPEPFLAAVASTLAWAVAESDLPSFRETRAGLVTATTIEPGTRHLEGPIDLRGPDAVSSMIAALRAGTSPLDLLDAATVAALDRLARYDLTWSSRAEVTTNVRDAARPFLFARCARDLLARGASHERLAVAHAVQAAGLLAKLRRREGGRSLPPVDQVLAIRSLLAGGPARDLAARATILGALLDEARLHPDRAPVVAAALAKVVAEPPPSLARAAAAATRHVTTGPPPEDD